MIYLVYKVTNSLYNLLVDVYVGPTPPTGVVPIATEGG